MKFSLKVFQGSFEQTVEQRFVSLLLARILELG